MWTKPYGTTGHNLSVIGFGAMRFANPADLDASAQTVLHAHARGINYFDTAPFYCDDKSEIIVGRALKTLPRNSYFVSTKCGEAHADPFRKSLERSLDRLHTDHIDFFHIWCLLRPDQLHERLAHGAIPAALKAKDEGLIRHLVVSTHLPGKDIAAVLDSGLFAGVTLGYNALNFPFRQEALAAAQRLHLGVATMNPLGGGMIPRNASRLAFLKSPVDRTVTEAALRFNISHPAVTVALVGFSNSAEVDEAVAAVDNFQPYPASHIEQIKSHITTSFDGFCTGCGYCLPCPADVAIPKFMDAYNQKILEGKDSAIPDRLKWHWGLSPDLAAACTDCGQCESECTQHINIPERLQQIAALMQKA